MSVSKEKKIEDFQQLKSTKSGDVKRLMAAIIVSGMVSRSQTYTPNLTNLESISEWVETLYNFWEH